MFLRLKFNLCEAIPAARRKQLVHLAKSLSEIEVKLKGCKLVIQKFGALRKKPTDVTAKAFTAQLELAYSKFDLRPRELPTLMRVEALRFEAEKEAPHTCTHIESSKD